MLSGKSFKMNTTVNVTITQMVDHNGLIVPAFNVPQMADATALQYAFDHGQIIAIAFELKIGDTTTVVMQT